jgi:hypothetical protein
MRADVASIGLGTRIFRTPRQFKCYGLVNGHSATRRPLLMGWMMSVSVMGVPLLKAHKYSIGQHVRYTAGPFSRVGSSGSFTVVKLLPVEGDEHQYRIKSNGEAFERVAKESQLDRDH